MADEKTDKPAKPPAPPLMTEEDFQRFIERREEWKRDPELFSVWTLDQTYLYVQVLDRIALRPPAGRSAGMVSMNAIREIRALAEVMIDLMREAGVGKRKT